MYNFYIHLEGTDALGVKFEKREVLELPTNNFNDLVEKVKAKHNLAIVTIVNFRNLGKVEANELNLTEGEDDMAKKATTKKATKKTAAKKPATKKASAKKEI